MTQSERVRDSQHRRIVLLAAQAFALGLTTAWIIIPASAIFLATYGPGLLPATYIGAAVAGVVASRSIAIAVRKRPLASVATFILAGLALALLTSWMLLRNRNADWVSFGLLVLVPILVPVGFVLVVGQAGMLLDVRALKALYARVVAGFALGFVTGGATGPLLLDLFGHTEDVLAAAAAAAGLFLVVVEVTRRSFPMELSVVEQADPAAARPTLRVLLRSRYVLLIVGFQMLSAVESQWLDFLVFDRAAQRYHDSTELAQFVSKFSTVAYGADILFLLLVAGFLLGRFGLRYGLTANATGVLVLVAATIVAASFQGPGATLVFVLIVSARVADLVLSDGAARTSLSAAYQVVPAPLRLASQANIEGLAVPIAIGASGVALLVVRAAGRINGSLLPALTALVLVAWIVVVALLYRAYRVNLLASLRKRTLDPEELTVDGVNALTVAHRLIESEEERDVRLGLDILTIDRHPALSPTLERLVADAREGVRIDVLERLVQLDPQAAAAAAREGLNDPCPSVRAACVHALGSARDPSDLEVILARSSDAAPVVKIAVAAALSRMGDDAVQAGVASEISRLSRASESHDRITAAHMLRECEPGSWLDRTLLRTLLADADDDVACAALAAIRWPEDAASIVEVVDRVRHRRSAGAAVDALVRCGRDVLGVVDDSLCSHQFGRRGQELLAASLSDHRRTVRGRRAAQAR